MYQNSPTAMQNLKNFPVTIHRTPVLGERKVGFISPKMYQNAPTAMQNYKKKSEVEPPNPVFGKGRGKLPPLEFMSGYATAPWMFMLIKRPWYFQG
jgi:hypothetical protein